MSTHTDTGTKSAIKVKKLYKLVQDDSSNCACLLIDFDRNPKTFQQISFAPFSMRSMGWKKRLSTRFRYLTNVNSEILSKSQPIWIINWEISCSSHHNSLTEFFTWLVFTPTSRETISKTVDENGWRKEIIFPAFAVRVKNFNKHPWWASSYSIHVIYEWSDCN